ncbi:helix-turn-helix domain-containing protein [Bacillus badius]|uniref:Transcriptional regulator, XRE family n=1 Tax=Bacillus badius TaxID=1455 RepID=A0ABR5B154_BACBA|nr:helix-turn-helix transcriptional regulator [Bacillus badius]KIL73689.1 Transcriptional regulator, XRE family [Bacillus badius]KIL80696.1 Transcriptional regulator, XRE family [Bacillus badius]MED4715377.1 helix-turn-helix transcriptional regulator [Bacillus badius]UAT31924.1 helix-turn-helix domain-containing protein [Bacillus badius]
MTLGERLRSLREKANLTQKELASRLKVPNQNISNYERDFRQPDYETLQKLADFYDVTTDYLLGRTNTPSPHQDLAAHRSDDHMDDLPEEAIRAIEEYKDYIRQKYGRKNRDGEF